MFSSTEEEQHTQLARHFTLDVGKRNVVYTCTHSTRLIKDVLYQHTPRIQANTHKLHVHKEASVIELSFAFAIDLRHGDITVNKCDFTVISFPDVFRLALGYISGRRQTALVVKLIN